MKTVKLNKAVLKAALIITPSKDIHDYLNGVCIKPTTEQTYDIVSTCGAVLFICNGCSGKLDESIIIPVETVKAALKLIATKDESIELVITESTMQLGGITFKSKEGSYPDYTRAIPTQHNEGVSQFNFELMAKAQNAMRIATGSLKGLFKVEYNGTSAAKMLSVNNPNIVTVVMPLRSNNENIFS